MKTIGKKRIVTFIMAALMALCALTACGEPVENASSAESGWKAHKFGTGDLTVNGVSLGMTAEEVKDKLGKPDKEENVTEDQFIYGEHLDINYGKMLLSFYDISGEGNSTLSSISTYSPEVEFPGGLHVGSTKEEVLAAFAQDDNAPDLEFYGEKYGTFIYGDMTSGDFLSKKPTGVIEAAYIQDHDAEEDGYYMMIYTYYNPLKWSEDGNEFSGDYYQLVFYVDTATDKVTSILLSHDLTTL